MESTNKKLIAVTGATGQQGGAVVRVLQDRNQFKVGALTRNPAKHRELADEVVEADLNRPETLATAFNGAYGVFLVTVQDPMMAQIQMVMFMKNVSMLGGALLISQFGAGPFSLDAHRSR